MFGCQKNLRKNAKKIKNRIKNDKLFLFAISNLFYLF